MDGWLFVALNRLGTPTWDAFMWAVSELGKGEFATFITLILVGVARRKLDWRASASILAAALLAGVLSSGIKDLVSRPRPLSTLRDDVRVVGEELRQRSFPSGHTACAAALCVSACLPLRRRRAWIVGGTLAGLVGLSRIYVGAHYPADVLAGAMVGVLGGLVGHRIQVALEARNQPR